MKIALVALVFVAATGFTPAQPANPNNGDAAAIRTIVDHWREMWERFDASSLQNDYADDADFVNAFGTRLKGRAEIVAFAARVVQRPNVQDRRTTWSPPLIRFVRADVAVVSRDYETAGFRTLSGQPMATRKTHGLWVLSKDHGVWRIVSHMISDENSAS